MPNQKENLIAGFQKWGIYLFDEERALKKLPESALTSDEAMRYSLVSEVFVEHLERMRYVEHLESMRYVEHLERMRYVEYLERMRYVEHLERMRYVEHLERMRYGDGSAPTKAPRHKTKKLNVVPGCSISNLEDEREQPSTSRGIRLRN